MLHQIQEEQLPFSQAYDTCTYWAANPAFDPQEILLRHLFIINEDRSKYVSVGFYTARDYTLLVEFGAIKTGRSKLLILADEQVETLVGCLPSISDSMCIGRDRVIIKCEIGNFRLRAPRRHGLARLYVGTEYISLTQPDIAYLVRVFHIVRQQLRNYIIALPDVLPYLKRPSLLCPMSIRFLTPVKI